jgi:hypothetical protein
MDQKLEALLRSRKFWATNIALTVALVMFRAGEINGQQLVNALTVATGIYVGSTALEDGLTNLLGILVTDPNGAPVVRSTEASDEENAAVPESEL